MAQMPEDRRGAPRPGIPRERQDFSEILPFRGDARWFSRGGHFYVASRSRGDALTMRCAYEYPGPPLGVPRPKCPVRWTLHGGEAGPIVGQHDHELTPWVPNRNTMFQALKRRSPLENIPLTEIYEQEVARYPDAASHLLYDKVKSSMLKWRRRVQPPVPRNLRDYAVALTNHPQYSSMVLATVSVAGATALILVMNGFEGCLGESDVLVVDGTFQTIPAGLPAAQILTVHAVINGHFFHPAIVLMENRRRVLYEAVFARLWQAAGNPRPSFIVTDYEQALRSALVSITNVPVQGCYFHFVQALLRMAHQLRMQVRQRSSRDWPLVRLYATLALLPAAQVPLGLPEIQEIARAQGFVFNDEFHQYFQNYWMTRVGPDVFSVHGSAHRTSNVAESFHASLATALRAGPNVWKFTEVISNKFGRCASRREAQARGEVVRRNTEDYYARTAVVTSNARALERGTITLRQFLLETSRGIDVGIGVVVLDVPEAGQEVVVGDLMMEPEVVLEELPEVVLGAQEPPQVPILAMEPEVVPEAVQEVVLEVQEPPPAPIIPDRPASPPGIVADNQPPQFPRCVVCMDNPLQVVLIPCGHAQCRSCVDQILIIARRCPICRAYITSTNPLFLN